MKLHSYVNEYVNLQDVGSSVKFATAGTDVAQLLFSIRSVFGDVPVRDVSNGCVSFNQFL